MDKVYADALKETRDVLQGLSGYLSAVGRKQDRVRRRQLLDLAEKIDDVAGGIEIPGETSHAFASIAKALRQAVDEPVN